MALTGQADFHDTRVIRTTGLSIVIDNGEIHEIAESFHQGAASRALVGGSWALVTSDDPGDTAQLVNMAVTLAGRIHARSPRKPIELAAVSPPVVHDLPVVERPPQDISIQEKVDLLLEMQTRARVPEVTSTSVIYSEHVTSVEYTSSEGVEAEYSLVRTGFMVSAVASQNGIYQIGRESRFGVCGYELFDRYDALKLAEKAGTTACDLLSARVPKGGRMPVILDQELAGVFIHEAVGHAVEADHVIQHNSILADRFGRQVAAPCITVMDDPSLHGFGYYPVDDEGVEAGPTTLIREGVLTSYLHSRETAELLPGTGSPGHARAQGLSRPIIRMSNTFIENGDSHFAEMLEEMQDGIYLMGSRGGQVNPGEGVFQFNAEQGFLVEHGELTAPLRDVSLSGHILDILQHVRLVADDKQMHSGRCGKSGQMAPVSDGSPHIMITEATVGGSG